MSRHSHDYQGGAYGHYGGTGARGGAYGGYSGTGARGGGYDDYARRPPEPHPPADYGPDQGGGRAPGGRPGWDGGAPPRDPPRRAEGRSGPRDFSEGDLRAMAHETVAICRSGSYRSASGRTVDISAEVRRCVSSSVLYRPDHIFRLGPAPLPRPCRVDVSQESVIEACQRLSASGGKVAALNFASATKPGGGFLNGRVAQEEVIARASALFPSIERHREMYSFGERDDNPLYSDYMIYSPAVPFFRDDSGQLLDRPFAVSLITSAAPNASLIHGGKYQRALQGTMMNRLRKIMQVAAEHGDRVLVLGAFGCGVFANDPRMVATCIRELLIVEELGRYFELVANPITGRAGTANYEAFRSVLAR